MVYYKKIFLFFFIVIFLFTTSCSALDYVSPSQGFTGTDVVNQYDNNYLTLNRIQENVQKQFISTLYVIPRQTAIDVLNVVSALLRDTTGASPVGIYIDNMRSEDTFYLYSYYLNGLSYNASTTFYQYGNLSFQYTPMCQGTFFYRTLTSSGGWNPSPGSSSLEIPQAFTNVFVSDWKQAFTDFGITDTAISQKLDELINNYNSNITSIEQKVEDLNQSANNINNSINDSNVNVDSSLPTNDTNDVTLDGFNSIFNTLYTAFTSSASNDIILPIPFTDKSITINYANVFGAFSFGVLSSIISAFWYFVICLFIVKDIKNKINSIKAGNIENVQTSNIKGDLL